MTAITEGALSLNPREVSAKFPLLMFYTGDNFVLEVGTKVAVCIPLVLD